MEDRSFGQGNKAQLVLTRKWNLIGAARAARLVMDDVEIAKLGPGETVTLEVSPGRHVLSVRSGSGSGPQSIVEFAPGETVHLSSNPGRLGSDDGRPSVVSGIHHQLPLFDDGSSVSDSQAVA